MTATQTITPPETAPDLMPEIGPKLELMEAQLKALSVGLELLRARAANIDLALSIAHRSRRRWWQ